MTPEERNLVSELFGRLTTLENAPRDPDAERAIRDGMRGAPNAVYALVQTAIVQDEALKRADARIRELEAQQGSGAAPVESGGFLGSMRDALTGRRAGAGSVPTVRPSAAAAAPMGAPPPAAPPAYAQPAQPGYPQPGSPTGGAPPAGGGGGSFLGTAAAAAAGTIGASLLLDSIRGMMGGGHRHAAGDFGSLPGSARAGEAGGSPWGHTPGSGGDAGGGGGTGSLARDAGLDDIGRGSSGGRGHGAFDRDAAKDDDHDDDHDDDDDDDDNDDDDDDFSDDDGDDGDDGGGGGGDE